MSERARTCGQDINARHQSALDVFARNLACGMRAPPSATGPANIGVLLQLPEQRRGWLRCLAWNLRLSEGDIVAAAAGWWRVGGSLPGSTAVADHLRQPASTHDPPS